MPNMTIGHITKQNRFLNLMLIFLGCLSASLDMLTRQRCQLTIVTLMHMHSRFFLVSVDWYNETWQINNHNLPTYPPYFYFYSARDNCY